VHIGDGGRCGKEFHIAKKERLAKIRLAKDGNSKTAGRDYSRAGLIPSTV